MELRDSKTFENLFEAWAAETQNHAKYLYFAEKAEKDGLKRIADIFRLTAKNELAHSKEWYELINGIKDTGENLRDACRAERYEWADMYAQFAMDAEADGFPEIAGKFKNIGGIEKSHLERYEKELKALEGGYFSRGGESVWVCLNCGYTHTGQEAPSVCPVCSHPQSWYYLKSES